MRLYLISILTILLLSSVVSATINLDFRLDVEEKGFYPNEKILLLVTVVNRDTSFSAKDAVLTINVGQRFYTFDVGTLKKGKSFTQEIELPEFNPGTHSIEGWFNYTA